MKQEIKFRFVGDQRNLKPHFETGVEYFSSFKLPGAKFGVLELVEKFPEDWEEVTEKKPTRIPNQDQPASEMTKFEKCVIDIIGNIYSNINIKTQTPTYQEISQIAINQAKETFKQLENLKK